MNLNVWKLRETGCLKDFNLKEDLFKKNSFLNLFFNVVRARLKNETFKQFSFKERFFTK